MDPMVPYPPVVEPDLPGAFITKHPRDVINIHGNTVPWMSGINSDEGVMKTAGKRIKCCCTITGHFI